MEEQTLVQLYRRNTSQFEIPTQPQRVCYDKPSGPADLAQEEIEVMPSQLRTWQYLAQTRLSRRIALWVFVCIVLIEIVILLPSVYRRQRELLTHLQAVSTAETIGALATLPPTAPAPEVMARLQTIANRPAPIEWSFYPFAPQNEPSPTILGAALYQINQSTDRHISAQMIGSFGERPALSLPTDVTSRTELYQIQPSRYDVVLPLHQLSGRYILIVRHDASQVQRELLAFIGRIAGLVAIIAVFVTIATLVGLKSMLIMPILKLRQDLLKAGEAIAQDADPPVFQSIELRRPDELGDVIAAFHQMHQQVLAAIEDRKMAAQASARLAEIGELSAMIVHEVRNPLTTVLMGLNSLQKLDLPTAAQLRLELALEEADRLQRLLNEILAFTRCQTLQTQVLDINRFLIDMKPTLAAMPFAQQRSIVFRPAPAPTWIQADSDKLKQIVINLVSNACEAVDAGETITCFVKFQAGDRYVDFSIHNDGPPIPPEILTKLTKPFYTTKSSGNGLGLAIVKRIVEAHAGELIIESDPERGTIVTVRLPVVEEERRR